MPDEYDKLGTPVQADPYAALGVPVDDEYAKLGTPTKEQRLQSFDAAQAQPYDPRQDLGTPGISDPDEGVLSKIIQFPAHALGAVLGAPQRGIATGLQNIAAGLGNSPESYVGVKPDATDVAGTIGGFIKAPFAAALGLGPAGSFEGQREALGFKGLPTRVKDSQGQEFEKSYTTPQGTDWGEFAKHAVQGITDLAGNTIQDPLFYTHPGLTTEGKAAHAARIGEVEARAKGALRGENDFISRDFTTPPTSNRLNEFGAQIRIPGLSPIDVPIPEAFRPAAKVYDALNARLQKSEAGGGDWLNKLGGVGRFFSEPSSTSVEGIAQNIGTNQAFKYATEQVASRLAARQKGFNDLGFTPAQRTAVSFAAELADQDLPSLALRAPGKAGERLFGMGFDVMQDFEGELKGHLDNLVKNGDLKPEQASQYLAEGINDFEKQANFVADEFHKMTPDQLAFAYDSTNAFKQMGKSVRQDVMTRFGVDLPELGGAFRKAPIETMEKAYRLQEQIDDAMREERTAQFEEHAGPSYRQTTTPSKFSVADSLSQNARDAAAWFADELEKDPTLTAYDRANVRVSQALKPSITEEQFRQLQRDNLELSKLYEPKTSADVGHTFVTTYDVKIPEPGHVFLQELVNQKQDLQNPGRGIYPENAIGEHNPRIQGKGAGKGYASTYPKEFPEVNVKNALRETAPEHWFGEEMDQPPELKAWTGASKALGDVLRPGFSDKDVAALLDARRQAQKELSVGRSVKPGTTTSQPTTTIAKNVVEDTTTEGGRFIDPEGRLPDEAFIFSDKIAKLQADREALLSELPGQLRRYAAVPSFFPGRVAAEARETAMRAGNPALRDPGASSGVESAQRGSVHSERVGNRMVSDVPMSTGRIIEEIAKGSGGTEATAGRAVAEAQNILEGKAPSVADRFLTKIGFKDAQDFYNPQRFLKTDPVEAWAQYLGKDIFKPVRNAQTDGIYSRSFKTIPQDAYQAVQDAVRNGIPLTGSLDPVGATKKATLDDLREAYKKNGGTGTLEELMSPKTFEEVYAGKMSLEDAFKAGQPPDGMIKTTLHGQPVWMDEAIASDLQEWKQLGNDPNRFGAVARNIGPYYQTWLQLWRKAATQVGPQFVAYNIRNALGDAVRLWQRGAFTPQVAQDIVRFAKPTWNVMKTGNTAEFSVPAVDIGHLGKISGPEFMDLAREMGVPAQGQLAADIMEGSQKAYLKARNNKGANLLQKASDAGDYLMSLTAAREDAQRLAAFAHFMRKGSTPYMAAMQVEDALFNMRRMSPAADFARKTGIAPFVWPFKNIPFQVRFAFENPGAFGAIVRGLGMIENGDMTDDMLPKWMKNKFNYVLGSRREPNGHVVHTVLTDDGVNPITDFTQLAHAVNQGDGLGWLQQNVGPMFQMAANVVEHNSQNEARQGEGLDTSPFWGRPKTSWNALGDTIADSRDKFGEQKGVVRRAVDLTINPFKAHDVDVTRQAQISVGSAKAALRGYQGQLKNAQRDLDAATEQANQEQAQQNLATLLGTESQFSNLQQRVDRARQGVERAKRIRDRVRGETQKALARAEQLNLAN